VHRVRIDGEGDREWYVAQGEEGLAWRLGAPSSEAVAQGVGRIRALLGDTAELPYDTELGLAAGAWMRSLGEALGAGLVLVMDYGYPRRELYHPQRRQGTLACHYRHRRHGDPLALPGLQDITAHVDFTTLAEAATEAGLRVAGLATQARFLLDQGLLERLPRDVSPADPGWVAMAQAVRRLLLPGEMGELVKVLALTRGIDPPPGMGGPDLRARL
jgi:SAM-dependent MidA family methyltransferase